MLHTSEIIKLVADKLREYKPQHIVVDPVMVAKSKHRLLQREAIDSLINDLLPIAHLITPNIPEAEDLLGMEITNIEQMHDAAFKLLELGPQAVLLKGGHLEGNKMADILVYGKQHQWFEAEKIETRNTHGTGCTLSSAITALLAQGKPMPIAVTTAKKYLTGAIAAGSQESIGKGQGPVHHFYHLWPHI